MNERLRARRTLAALVLGLALGTRPAGAAVLEFRPEVGTSYERYDQSKDVTKIVKPETIYTQTLEMAAKQVGRVMDGSDGEIRIVEAAMQSALKVNGKRREGGVPGADVLHLRVFSPTGELVRTNAPDRVAGDLRELALRMPEGEVAPGKRWKQTFNLAAGEDAEPVPVEAQFEIVGAETVLGRDGWKIRGALRLKRQWTPKKLVSTYGEGKIAAVLDSKTGLPLARTMKMHFEQVREDGISKAYVQAGGQKLGFYLDITREEKTTYFGTGTPPALEKLQK